MAMARGGKSTKVSKHQGRPRGAGPSVLIDHIKSIAPRTSPLPQPSETQTLSAIDHLKCPVCLEILSQPVQLPCQSLVCASCVTGWLTVSASSQCPCCFSDTALDPGSINPAPSLILQLLGDVLVDCPTCKVCVKSRSFGEHQCTPQPKRVNQDELQVTSSVIHQLLSESPENLVEIPTKGTVSHKLSVKCHTFNHVFTALATDPCKSNTSST